MPLNDDQLRERMNQKRSPVNTMLGGEIQSLDTVAGRLRMRFEARREFCNPMGSVQGGIVTAMLDEAAGLIAVARSRSRAGVPSLEIKVSFLAAARAGELFVEARVLKLGRSVAFMEADLLTPDGKLLARLITTAMIVPNDDPQLIAT